VDEILAHVYWKEKGVPTIIVRLFNTVGPRQTGYYGMVVPRFVGQALAGQPLQVHGTGKQSRCFLHVQDVVEAFSKLLDNPKAVGDVFNIGSQEEVTIEELATRVLTITGGSSKITYIPYEEAYEAGYEDMMRRVPDISKVAGLIGFRPTRKLDDIIRDVVDDLRRQPVSPVAGRG
jgi:UDP-glucose 4-epimerase